MDQEKKKLIAETVENLKQLDKESLLLMKNGSELLKARDDLDKERIPDKKSRVRR